MPVKYQPVAIPVAKGIDVTTRARLVDPQALLEAENARFTALGSQKRRGHVGRVVRGTKPLPPGISPPAYQSPSRDNIPAEWLWGWGHMYETTRTDPGTLLGTSPHPDAGVLFGAATRDNEALFWDGFRLFSRLPEQEPGSPMTEIPAVMPHLHAYPSAKANHGQTQPDMADNGTVRVVAWLNSDDGDAWYTVQDSTTGAAIVAPMALGYVDPVQVRVVNVGSWVHVLVAENDVDILYAESIHDEDPLTITQRSLGPCNQYFDVFKLDESEWVVARNQGDLTVQVTYLDPDGSASDTGAFTYDYSSTWTTITTVAITVAHTGEFCVVARGEAAGPVFTVRAWLYDTSGVEITTELIGSPDALTGRVTVAAHYILNTAGEAIYDVYYDDTVTDVPTTVCRRVSSSGTHVTTTRHWHYLASQAFRVGDRTFVWCQRPSALQNVWMLMDESLLPVGHMDFITAIPTASDDFPFTASMNFVLTGELKDVFNYHGALGYRVRVPVTTPATGANEALIYTEPSIKLLTMNFLPPLYSAQAGRCTYFPGAQLWVYDGVELVEQGFHVAPELAGSDFEGGVS